MSVPPWSAITQRSGGVPPAALGGQDASPPLLDLETELNDRVAALYNLTQEERKIIGGRPGEEAREVPGEKDGEE